MHLLGFAPVSRAKIVEIDVLEQPVTKGDGPLVFCPSVGLPVHIALDVSVRVEGVVFLEDAVDVRTKPPPPIEQEGIVGPVAVLGFRAVKYRSSLAFTSKSRSLVETTRVWVWMLVLWEGIVSKTPPELLWPPLVRFFDPVVMITHQVRLSFEHIIFVSNEHLW